MRRVKNKQLQLGATPISKIKFDLNSRDDIPQLLMGLQYIYVTKDVWTKVQRILINLISNKVDWNNGRPGLELWKVLVLGVLRLNLNCDYDRLHEMANNHYTVRQMLGHGLFSRKYVYKLQTIKDNVRLFTPEILDKINQVVVKAGQSLVLKKDEVVKGKCDSFVVETDVHFPTDVNLLFDAIRKSIKLIAELCDKHQIKGWRQDANNIRQVKKLYRRVQKSKHSTSNNSEKKQKQEKKINKAHLAYIESASYFLGKTIETLETFRTQGIREEELEEIKGFIKHAHRQIDQIERRVFKKEDIPHKEKVFSLFEEHTEWISKGKAGVPVELGLRVCVVEDQHRFILHHCVMQQQTDDQVAVSMVKDTQKRFPSFKECSFDKGFHSPSNQESLKEILDLSVLPRKGRLSKKAQEHEHSSNFVKAKRQHSAIESAINGLEVHGLDICLDHGIEGFERYVSLAVLARNIQTLGSIIQKKKIKSQQLSQRRKKAA